MKSYLNSKPVFFIFTAALLALAFFLIPAAAQGPEKPPDPGQVEIIGKPVEPVIINVDMNSLPPAQTSRPGAEIPRLTRPPLNPNVPPPAPALDPLLKTQQNAVSYRRDRDFDTTLLNFEGFSEAAPPHPPDTVGDVGPNHYIQMTNGGGTSVMIFDKTGAQLGATFSLSSLWTGGGACASGYGDPIVLYDRLADRWMLAEFASSGNHLCIYISQTPDPTAGTWYGYDFETPTFPDYPKYAVWGDAYYAGANEGPAVYAFDRQNMLAGNTARPIQRFTAPGLSGFSFEMLIPGDLDGATPPPTGAPAHFMRHRDTESHGDCADTGSQDCLEIWDFHVDWDAPANSTFARVQDIAVTEFDSDLCGLSSFYCFPQPGSSTTLDPLREVVMWRLQYRNFGGYESLVGNFVTDVNGSDHGGIRWFELRKSGSNPWALYQEGTYAPDASHRWMGSIAMDGSGNIALAYSVSDATSVYPSLRYAGRLASDPLNTLPQGEYSIIAGGSASGSNRWGDYSAMSVDPADDCTFWFTGEYMPASGDWHTRIASFKFDACGSADFTLSANPPVQEICAPNPADFTISVGQVQSYTDQVTLSVTGNPAGTTAAFAANPLTPAAPPATTTLTISNTGAAAAGSYTMNIVGAAATSTHTSTVQLNLYAAAPGAVTLNSPANNALNVSVTPSFSWTAAAQAQNYLLEVASDSGFNSVVYSATVQGTQHTMSGALNTGSVYYWRVTAANSCGVGGHSVTYKFTTASAPGDCGPGTSPNILFSDDFESGATGWSHTGTGDTWSLATSRPHGGIYSYFAADSPSVSDQQLTSPAVTLPVGENPLTVQFWNWQEIEDSSSSGCYDGAILEISTDGGNNWTQLETELLTDPYDGQISSSWQNPLAGLNGWCGDPQDWLNSVADLSAYAGQTVNFRFRLGTDSSIGHEGWHLDDVKVQSCRLDAAITLSKTVGLDPNVCATTNSLVVNSGTDVTYCYRVQNTGSFTLGTHYLYDDQLGDLLNGVYHPLPPGDSYIFTATAAITADITNTAVWTAVQPGTLPISAHASDSARVELPHYNVNLSENQTQSANAGDAVTYTVQLTNTGNVSDSFALNSSGMWTATHPALLGVLAPGEQGSFTVRVTIPPSAAFGASDPLTLTATSQTNGNAEDSVRLLTLVRIPTYTLTMTQVGSGVITPSVGTHVYTHGTTVTLSQKAAEGWEFAGFSGNASGAVTATVFMDANKAVTATFTAIPTYTLNYTTVGSGTIALQPTGIDSGAGYAVYYYGAVVTATALPASGWNFGNWSGDFSGSAVMPQTTVLMDANKAITATFTKVGNNYSVYLPVVLK